MARAFAAEGRSAGEHRPTVQLGPVERPRTEPAHDGHRCRDRCRARWRSPAATSRTCLLPTRQGGSVKSARDLAIGAGRARVVRQLLTESVVLGACAGVAGLLLSQWLTPLAGSCCRYPSSSISSPISGCTRSRRDPHARSRRHRRPRASTLRPARQSPFCACSPIVQVHPAPSRRTAAAFRAHRRPGDRVRRAARRRGAPDALRRRRRRIQHRRRDRPARQRQLRTSGAATTLRESASTWRQRSQRLEQLPGVDEHRARRRSAVSSPSTPRWP